MRLKKSLTLFLSCLLCCSLLTACDNKKPVKPAPPEPHVCGHVCDTCGKCQTDCNDPVCADKCNGHEVPVGKNVGVTFTIGGTDEKLGFDTIEEATAAVERKIAESTARVDAVIALAAGEHRLTETLELDGNAIRSKDYSITIKGAGADKTTLSSNVVISPDDIEDYGNGQYGYALPETFKTDGKFPAIRDFSIDGKQIHNVKSEKYTLAYEPNVNDEMRSVYLDSRLFAGMSETDINNAELWIENIWNIIMVHLESFDPSNTRTNADGDILYAATIRSSDFDVLMNKGGTSPNYSDTLVGNKYFIANSDFFLTEDAVETFVYKQDEGKFFVQLDSDVDVDNVELAFPVLDKLLSLENVKNVTISDIRFTGTTNTFIAGKHYVAGQAGSIATLPGEYAIGFLPISTVFVNGAADMTVERCAFDGVGTDALNFRGAVDRVRIEGNSFTDVGGTAIRLADTSGSGYDHFYDANSHYCDIVITNNYINGAGTTCMSSPAIQIGHIKNLELTHNTILHSSYSAISVGWGWRAISDEAINVYNAEIAYNYIEGFMENLADGGAIYVLGGNASFEWTEKFNSIHDNYCAVIDTTKTNNYTVIYLDGSSTNWSIDKNVIRSLNGATPKMNFINFQSVGGQQVFNCEATNNYVVGITNADVIFGTGLVAGEQYHLYEENNHAVADYAALDNTAKGVITTSGCEKAHGKWNA